jgi:hypothetical protein
LIDKFFRKEGRKRKMEQIEKSLKKLEKWIEDHNYKGYEPFDGLSSFLYPLTCGSLLLERVLQQLVRQSPINLRPLLGVKPLESTKGRGYIAWGYLRMYELTKNEIYKEKTIASLQWLDENKCPFYDTHSWGNHFEYSARGGRIPKYESTIVWTSLIGQAFLDAYVKLKNDKYLDVAISACSWILSLSRLPGPSGFCLSYTGCDKGSTIHNSNMLGAAMLSRTAKFTGNQEYLDVAKQAMAWSCADQLADGAWNYGADPMFHWVDNFHTGYNLDSLKCYIDNTGDKTFEENLTRGYRYFKDHFFEESGRPKYYHNRAYPIDLQCASQAIDTLLYFSEQDETALPLAHKVARWTIENMQDPTGYFWYRLLPKMKVKIPMIHWGQATMYKSLSSLLLEASERRKI